MRKCQYLQIAEENIIAENNVLNEPYFFYTVALFKKYYYY